MRFGVHRKKKGPPSPPPQTAKKFTKLKNPIKTPKPRPPPQIPTVADPHNIPKNPPSSNPLDYREGVTFFFPHTLLPDPIPLPPGATQSNPAAIRGEFVDVNAGHLILQYYYLDGVELKHKQLLIHRAWLDRFTPHMYLDANLKDPVHYLEAAPMRAPPPVCPVSRTLRSQTKKEFCLGYEEEQDDLGKDYVDSLYETILKSHYGGIDDDEDSAGEEDPSWDSSDDDRPSTTKRSKTKSKAPSKKATARLALENAFQLTTAESPPDSHDFSVLCPQIVKKKNASDSPYPLLATASPEDFIINYTIDSASATLVSAPLVDSRLRTAQEEYDSKIKQMQVQNANQNKQQKKLQPQSQRVQRQSRTNRTRHAQPSQSSPPPPSPQPLEVRSLFSVYPTIISHQEAQSAGFKHYQPTTLQTQNSPTTTPQPTFPPGYPIEQQKKMLEFATTGKAPAPTLKLKNAYHYQRNDAHQDILQNLDKYPAFAVGDPQLPINLFNIAMPQKVINQLYTHTAPNCGPNFNRHQMYTSFGCMLHMAMRHRPRREEYWRPSDPLNPDLAYSELGPFITLTDYNTITSGWRIAPRRAGGFELHESRALMQEGADLVVHTINRSNREVMTDVFAVNDDEGDLFWDGDEYCEGSTPHHNVNIDKPASDSSQLKMKAEVRTNYVLSMEMVRSKEVKDAYVESYNYKTVDNAGDVMTRKGTTIITRLLEEADLLDKNVVVFADSHFGSANCVSHLSTFGVLCVVNVKQSHLFFPKSIFEAVAPQIGDFITFSSVDNNAATAFSTAVHTNRTQKDYCHNFNIPGSFFFQHNFYHLQHQDYHLPAPAGLYLQSANRVDIHNQLRREIDIERKTDVHHWEAKFVSFLVNFTIVQAYCLYRFLHHQAHVPPVYSTFCKQLLVSLMYSRSGFRPIPKLPTHLLTYKGYEHPHRFVLTPTARPCSHCIRVPENPRASLQPGQHDPAFDREPTSTRRICADCTAYHTPKKSFFSVCSNCINLHLLFPYVNRYLGWVHPAHPHASSDCNRLGVHKVKRSAREATRKTLADYPKQFAKLNKFRLLPTGQPALAAPAPLNKGGRPAKHKGYRPKKHRAHSDKSDRRTHRVQLHRIKAQALARDTTAHTD